MRRRRDPIGCACSTSPVAANALHAGIVGVIKDGRVLSAAIDGRVLVLKSDARRTWVDGHAAPALRPLGTVVEGPGCGDRLLASRSRVAIVCRSTGEIAVDDLRGNQAAIDGALPHLATAAMADDGTLYVAAADEQLAAVAVGATKLVSVPRPSEWSGRVLTDGLAVARGGASELIEHGSAPTFLETVKGRTDKPNRRDRPTAARYAARGTDRTWPHGCGPHGARGAAPA